MAIFEILVDDFNLTLELHLRRPSFPLRCSGWVDAVGVGVVRECECAAEQHQRKGDEEATNDPGGTDLSHHLCTFL